MSVVITEMQPTDFKEVVTFFAEHEVGERCPFKQMDAATLLRMTQHNANLNLVARKDHKLVGVFLCGRGNGVDRVQHVVVDQAESPIELRTLLLNNALRKLASHSVYKCRISLDSTAEQAGELWEGLAWAADEKFDAVIA